MAAVDLGNESISDAVTALVDEGNRHSADIDTLRTILNQAVADIASLYTAYNGHVHGGITAGSANTSAASNATAKTSGAVGTLTKKGLKKSGPQ